jgi:hypothetical protein
VDQAWKACGVLVRFYSVGCTSIQITTTLGYELLLVLWQSSLRQLNGTNGMLLINKLCLCFTIITYVPTFVWLSLGLSCLKLINLACRLNINYL